MTFPGAFAVNANLAGIDFGSALLLFYALEGKLDDSVVQGKRGRKTNELLLACQRDHLGLFRKRYVVLGVREQTA